MPLEEMTIALLAEAVTAIDSCGEATARNRPEATIDTTPSSSRRQAVRSAASPWFPVSDGPLRQSGQPAAVTAEEARDQLSYSVRAYLEAGPCPDPVPSTIVDLTGEVPQLLRAGAIPLEKLRDVVPDLLDVQGA